MSITKLFYTNLLVLSLFVFLLGGCNKSDPVVASFSTSASEVYPGDTIFFYNSSENATYYQWDFGDGETSILADPSHVYKLPGKYETSLVSIGENSTDSATKEIDVLLEFDPTIFEGVGIEGAHIADTWSQVQSSFTSDTTSFSLYDSIGEFYVHVISFETQGVTFVFPGTDSLISQQDSLSYIFVYFPYSGGTSKGIGLGSTMDKVSLAYGQPERIVSDVGITGYWYDSKGVDFYTYNTGVVNEIQIYIPIVAKSSSLTKPFIESMIRKRKLWIDF